MRSHTGAIDRNRAIRAFGYDSECYHSTQNASNALPRAAALGSIRTFRRDAIELLKRSHELRPQRATLLIRQERGIDRT